MLCCCSVLVAEEQWSRRLHISIKFCCRGCSLLISFTNGSKQGCRSKFYSSEPTFLMTSLLWLKSTTITISNVVKQHWLLGNLDSFLVKAVFGLETFGFRSFFMVAPLLFFFPAVLANLNGSRSAVTQLWP